MNDNLLQMVEEADQHSSSVPTETDLPAEQESTDQTDDQQDSQPEEAVQTQPQTQPETTQHFEISTTPFPDWFSQNHQNFTNVGHVRLSIVGVRPERNFIFKIPDPKGGQLDDGGQEMILCLFMDAHKIPVLDLPGSSINVYHNSTFKIVYDLGSGKFLKCYGVKTGLIVIFCANIGNKLIPYDMVKVKKKDRGLNTVEPNLTQIQQRLNQNVDRESLLLQYNQVNKSIDDITTIQSAVDWLLERTDSILDVNHLLQIDKVIINLLS